MDATLGFRLGGFFLSVWGQPITRPYQLDLMEHPTIDIVECAT